MSNDMEQRIGRLETNLREAALAIVRVEAKIEGLVTREEFSRGINAVMNKLDDFSRDVESARRERAFQDQSFNVLKGGLEDHEARLIRLERRGKKQ